MLGRLGLHFFKPGLDHLVGFVAGFIKTLPQRVVGHTPLVGQLPLIAQATQLVLHLASANGLTFRALEQALGLGHQFFAQLIGTPALPAFEFTRGHQRRVGLGFELVVNQAAVVLERLAQGVGRASAGLAMALAHFMLQLGQHPGHMGRGLGADLGVDLGLGRCRHRLQRNAARNAQLIRPHRHLGQRCGRVLGRGDGERQGVLERLPDQLQLGLRIVQLGDKANVDTGPVGIGHQGLSFGLPMGDIGGQRILGSLGVGPGLGRQHLDALRQQHRGLALHLHPVLQVFNGTHAFHQLRLQAGQRLLAQRRTGLGGIALPGQGVGQVEFAQGQQRLGLVGPFQRDGGLRLAALDFVELFAQQLGSTLVLATELLENLLQLLGARTGRQPFADAGHALARGLRRKRPVRERVQRMDLRGFGADGGRVRRGVGFALGRKREHRHRALK